MMQQFNTEKFIKENILYRDRSFFLNDIKKNKKKLKKNIIHKTVLIIGGAGTIGKSFIKELLNFSPKKVVVVDINENELTELTRDLRSNNNFIVPEIFLTYPVDFGSEIFFKIFEHHGPFIIRVLTSLQILLLTNMLGQKKIFFQLSQCFRQIYLRLKI